MADKQCTRCQRVKSVCEFPKAKNQKSGLNPHCRTCRNENQRKYRSRLENSVTHRYEKTKRGFLMRVYRNMVSRIDGVQSAKHHLYAGKSLFNRDEYYEWALRSEAFHRLFQEWETACHAQALTPTVDRVDSSKGYAIGNVEWVTHSENSRRGSYSRFGIKK